MVETKLHLLNMKVCPGYWSEVSHIQALWNESTMYVHVGIGNENLVIGKLVR